MRECVFETIRRVDDEWAAIIDDRTEGSAIVEGRVRNMQATPHSFLLFLALRPPKLSPALSPGVDSPAGVTLSDLVGRVEIERWSSSSLVVRPEMDEISEVCRLARASITVCLS